VPPLFVPALEKNQTHLPVRSAHPAPRSGMPSRRTVIERTAAAKGSPVAAPTAASKDLDDRANLGLIKWSNRHCLCGRYEG